MFRAFNLHNKIYIIRLTHLPTLSETIRLEDHRGNEFTPPNGNTKSFLRYIIQELALQIQLTKPDGTTKTTNELGKDIISML